MITSPLDAASPVSVVDVVTSACCSLPSAILNASCAARTRRLARCQRELLLLLMLLLPLLLLLLLLPPQRRLRAQLRAPAAAQRTLRSVSKM